MKGNKEVLLFALGILVDFVIVATVVSVTKDKYPRVAKWAKQIAAIPIVAMLLVGYFYGTPDAGDFGERIVGFLPHLGIALWAMFVLHFALQAQANGKSIEATSQKLSAVFDSMDEIVQTLGERISGVSDAAFRSAELCSRTESAKLESKWIDKMSEMSQRLHEFRRDVDALKATLDNQNEAHLKKIAARVEARLSDFGGTLSNTLSARNRHFEKKEEEFQAHFRSVEYCLQDLPPVVDSVNALRGELRNLGIYVSPPKELILSIPVPKKS